MRILIIVCFLTISCLNNNKVLPEAVGSGSEIIFVVEDSIWTSKMRSIVLEIFEASFKGISQNESVFTVVQINHSEFKSILKTHKNIVILSNKSASSKKNKWATDQLVVQLNYRDILLRDNLIKVKSIFEYKEISSIRKEISKKSQKSVEKSIYSKFNIDLIFPREYTILMDTANFFWATYNPKNKEIIKHLFVFSFSYVGDSLQQESLLRVDSIFAKYLLGNKKGQYVKVEPSFPISYFENTIKGLWRLENGFMGGPFIIKSYSDKVKKVVTVGLVFDPNKSKRQHMKIFESIL